MKLRSSLRLLMVLAIVSVTPFSWADPTPKPLVLRSPVQDKDFYLLSLLQTDPEVRMAFSQDQALDQLNAERQWFLSQALQTCKDNACRVHAFLWTDEEIGNVSFALARIYKESAPVRKLVEKNLRPSGAYVLYEKEDGALLLANAWQVCARGLNDILSVYGEGLAPRYPKIDSASFNVSSSDFQSQCGGAVERAAPGITRTATVLRALPWDRIAIAFP